MVELIIHIVALIMEVHIPGWQFSPTSHSHQSQHYLSQPLHNFVNVSTVFRLPPQSSRNVLLMQVNSKMDNFPNANVLAPDQYVHAVRLKLQSYHCEFVHVYEPSKVFLPMLFSIDFFDNIGKTVTLIDPVGNQFEALVEKHKTRVVLTQGTERIGQYYRLYNGGWLTFTYINDKMMFMEVRDRLHEPVVYPTPITSFYIGDCSNPINVDNDRVTNPPHPMIKVPEGSFTHSLILNLSDTDVTTDELNLAGAFVQQALNRTITKIHVVDDFGKLWPAKLKWDKSDPAKCKLTAGWLKFCNGRHLKPGNVICLGLPMEPADHIYFKFA